MLLGKGGFAVGQAAMKTSAKKKKKKKGKLLKGQTLIPDAEENPNNLEVKLDEILVE